MKGSEAKVESRLFARSCRFRIYSRDSRRTDISISPLKVWRIKSCRKEYFLFLCNPVYEVLDLWNRFSKIRFIKGLRRFALCNTHQIKVLQYSYCVHFSCLIYLFIFLNLFICAVLIYLLIYEMLLAKGRQIGITRCHGNDTRLFVTNVSFMQMRSEVSEIPIKTTIAFIYQPRGLFFPGQYLFRSVQLKLPGKPPRRANEGIHLRRNKRRYESTKTCQMRGTVTKICLYTDYMNLSSIQFPATVLKLQVFEYGASGLFQSRTNIDVICPQFFTSPAWVIYIENVHIPGSTAHVEIFYIAS